MRKKLDEAAAAALADDLEGIALFPDVLTAEPGQAYQELLKAISCGDAAACRRQYAALFGMVTAPAGALAGSEGPDVWQAFLAERILLSDNAFARAAERADWESIPQALREQAAHDLDALSGCLTASGDTLAEAVRSATGGNVVAWGTLRPTVSANAARLVACQSGGEMAECLAGCLHSRGAGLMGRFRAFKWSPERGMLSGVPDPDPIRLDQIWEYEWQKAELVRNTRKLLLGFPANNALLYGDRGTGKSSTVKALLNEFAAEGLRLVEVQTQDLRDFPRLLRLLRRRAQKFIVFVDDLSFEEDDTSFKALKAVLEGGVETRPDNVVLYATSNRRNLIRERFSDRQIDPDDEVHLMDTYQEKLSLADRFGIRLPFLAPDQEAFLSIVRNIARHDGIGMPEDELQRRALRWKEGRSGRSARQFINWLIGEQGLKQAESGQESTERPAQG